MRALQVVKARVGLERTEAFNSDFTNYPRTLKGAGRTWEFDGHKAKDGGASILYRSNKLGFAVSCGDFKYSPVYLTVDTEVNGMGFKRSMICSDHFTLRQVIKPGFVERWLDKTKDMIDDYTEAVGARVSLEKAFKFDFIDTPQRIVFGDTIFLSRYYQRSDCCWYELLVRPTPDEDYVIRIKVTGEADTLLFCRVTGSSISIMQHKKLRTTGLRLRLKTRVTSMEDFEQKLVEFVKPAAHRAYPDIAFTDAKIVNPWATGRVALENRNEVETLDEFEVVKNGIALKFKKSHEKYNKLGAVEWICHGPNGLFIILVANADNDAKAGWYLQLRHVSRDRPLNQNPREYGSMDQFDGATAVILLGNGSKKEIASVTKELLDDVPNKYFKKERVVGRVALEQHDVDSLPDDIYFEYSNDISPRVVFNLRWCRSKSSSGFLDREGSRYWKCSAPANSARFVIRIEANTKRIVLQTASWQDPYNDMWRNYERQPTMPFSTYTVPAFEKAVKTLLDSLPPTCFKHERKP